MNLVINDLSSEALPGQTLGMAARLNHSHVGYVCRGHGICQTCYVTVRQGSEFLSPLSEIEHAFLSERQVLSGGRLACQAIIERDGVINILSRPEEVRRLLFSNPLALLAYGEMTRSDTASKIVPGIANLAGRIVRGEVSTRDASGNILEAIGSALQFAVTSASQIIPFRQHFMGLLEACPASMPLLPSRQASVTLEPVVLKVSAPATPAVFDVPVTPVVSVTPVVPVTPVTSVFPAPPEVTVKTDAQPIVAVHTLDGINDAHAQKLSAAGVTSLEQLLERGCDKTGRKQLSTAAGINEDTLFRLVNRADLARVKGVGTTYAELLEAAGVASLFELSQRNPANLYAKMQAVNKLKKLVQLLPSADQVKEWVSQAKKLPRVVVS